MPTAYERVQAARNSKRPSGSFFIDRMIDGFIEFHGDRRYGDDPAIVGGIGWLQGKAVTVIAMERGDSIEDRMSRNFGCPSPEGYRKALRLMKEAEKFHRPVLCFIGSSGAFCGIEAEERGQGQAIAENLMEMSALKVPIISTVIGEGGSGGALALAVADSVVMLENSIYSVISPEGCASILWKDSKRAPDAAEALQITADCLYQRKIIDYVITETGRTEKEICSELKRYIMGELERLQGMSVNTMLQNRYLKFRRIGSQGRVK